MTVAPASSPANAPITPAEQGALSVALRPERRGAERASQRHRADQRSKSAAANPADPFSRLKAQSHRLEQLYATRGKYRRGVAIFLTSPDESRGQNGWQSLREYGFMSFRMQLFLRYLPADPGRALAKPEWLISPSRPR